eukprot:PhF_6_TR37097/c0_g1_i3/m.54459
MERQTASYRGGGTKSHNAAKIRRRWRIVILMVRFGVRLRALVRSCPLNAEEYRIARATYDEHGLGVTSKEKIKEMLQVVGLFCDDFEQTMKYVPFQEGRQFLFPSWIFLLEMLKREFERSLRMTDTDDAYVALGGSADKSAHLSTDLLKSVCETFDLNIDIDHFVALVDEDQSSTLDFHEFASIFSGNMNASEYEMFINDPMFTSMDIMTMPHRKSKAARRMKSRCDPSILRDDTKASSSSATNAFLAAAKMLSKIVSPRKHDDNSGVGFGGGRNDENAAMANSAGETTSSPLYHQRAGSLIYRGESFEMPDVSSGTPTAAGLSVQDKPIDIGTNKESKEVPFRPHPPALLLMDSKPSNVSVFNSSAPRLAGDVFPLKPPKGGRPLVSRGHCLDRTHIKDTRKEQIKRVKRIRRQLETVHPPESYHRPVSPVEDWELFNPFSSDPVKLITDGMQLPNLVPSRPNTQGASVSSKGGRNHSMKSSNRFPSLSRTMH